MIIPDAFITLPTGNRDVFGKWLRIKEFVSKWLLDDNWGYHSEIIWCRMLFSVPLQQWFADFVITWLGGKMDNVIDNTCRFFSSSCKWSTKYIFIDHMHFCIALHHTKYAKWWVRARHLCICDVTMIWGHHLVKWVQYTTN